MQIEKISLRRWMIFYGRTKLFQRSYWYVFLLAGIYKSCHLSVKLEHKDMWALKKLNCDRGDDSNMRPDQLNELDEFRLKSYEISTLYKEKMKMYHDQKI